MHPQGDNPASTVARSSSRVLAGLAYLLGVLVFFEVASRAVLAVPLVFKRVATTADAGWRLQWIRRPHPRGVAYGFDVYHPTRGWALRPNVRSWRISDDRFLNSNSKGLRGRAEHDYEKRLGVSRVLVFGDSFTFGEGVSDDDTYAMGLERLLGQGVEVLNFGVHGYGHDQMLLYLQQEGVRYHPDVVILGFVDWDMERNLLEFRDYAKPAFVLDADRLVLTNTPVPMPEQVLAGNLYRSRFLDLLSFLDCGVRAALGWRREEAGRVTVALLDAFRKTVAMAGAKLVVAYLPVAGEIEPSPQDPEGETFVARYCRERRVDWIDLRPAFVTRESEGDHLKTRGHWNRREHRLAAEALAFHVVAAHLLP